MPIAPWRLHRSGSSVQMCYRQDRDSTIPGYQAFTFLRYVVIHVRRVPFQLHVPALSPSTLISTLMSGEKT